jgi:hypothetical protein
VLVAARAREHHCASQDDSKQPKPTKLEEPSMSHGESPVPQFSLRVRVPPSDGRDRNRLRHPKPGKRGEPQRRISMIASNRTDVWTQRSNPSPTSVSKLRSGNFNKIPQSGQPQFGLREN